MKLFSWLAYYKYHVMLNKTQMQKLLYMFYGAYWAQKNSAPFTDDSPKAWPHGPVFPRVNVRYNPNVIPENLTESEKDTYRSNAYALKLADKIVRRFHNVSAYHLSEWSHQNGGPWWITIFGKDGNNQQIKWNTRIDDKVIKEYFNEFEKSIDNGK